MKDFFISYTKADQAWAEWIAWQLEHTQPPYTTIVQAWDFRPGTNFIQSMTNAAENSSRTIAVFSEDYFASNYTWSEWEAAFRQDPKGEKGILVPVRVKQCNIPKFLASLVFIDVVGKPETDATAELLKGVKPGRVTPAAAPPFPGVATTGTAVAPAPDATKKPEFPGIERYDVFMTYVDAETELVEEIARDLQSETLRVWRDRWIVTGPAVQRAVDPVLQRSNCVAICLGEQTPKTWFTDQLQAALDRQAAEESLKVVPVEFRKAPSIDKDKFGRLYWASQVNASRLLIAAVRGEPAKPQNGAHRRDSDTVTQRFQTVNDLFSRGLIYEGERGTAIQKLLDLVVEGRLGR